MLKGDTFNTDFTVTPQVYNGFIEIFNDRNILHTKKEFAQEKKFKDVVMHGNILNGFVSYFIGECLPVKNVMIISQEIKYAKPVYLNDELIMRTVLADIIGSVNVYEFKFSFYRKKDETKLATGKVQICLI
jgi:3-hydroxybutyryl-CoA dehydratase